MAKIPMAVRLTPVAKFQVEQLAEHLGLSQTAVIEQAVRAMAKKEKIYVGGSDSTASSSEAKKEAGNETD